MRHILLGAYLVIFIQLLLLPVGLSIDSSSKGMTIKYLLHKAKFIGVEDIESYGSTIITTKSENYEGMLLHLKSGENILLSNFNLKDIGPLKLFLDELKIEDQEKKTSASFLIIYKRSDRTDSDAYHQNL